MSVQSQTVQNNSNILGEYIIDVISRLIIKFGTNCIPFSQYILRRLVYEHVYRTVKNHHSVCCYTVP